ncbi:hypothetical protein HMPREF0454_00008 [Hafnia alvei ATCC 51873]|uniref:Uncharacterized protein n=1 Tax=Hafnia alvei ATCC 51873 TaxID=1002364 RepID=G9Y0F0_HAFAL|nr:hypothetical protein HMPREF0454_00008 [Hafnia alvei ATCC 51873]
MQRVFLKSVLADKLPPITHLLFKTRSVNTARKLHIKCSSV